MKACPANQALGTTGANYRLGGRREFGNAGNSLTFSQAQFGQTPFPQGAPLRTNVNSGAYATPQNQNIIVFDPQATVQILVSGDFTEFDGFPRAYMVRLRGDATPLRLGPPVLGSDGTLSLPVSPGGRPLASIEIQIATRLSPPDWRPVAGQWEVAEGHDLHRSAASSASGYYRAVTR